MTAKLFTDLTAQPLSVEAAYAFVSVPEAGAVVVFTGTVRRVSEGRTVQGLSYEAYTERATAQLDALAGEVTQRWQTVTAVWLAHRVGDLAIGEPAVVVAVSSPHRPDAFSAARWAIDELKATVAIWKKEHWADGGGRWPGLDE